nr:hypothetical protein GCM10020063_097460 [Dactylosporangium thailandense]
MTVALTRLSAGTSQWTIAALIALGGAGFGGIIVAAQSGVFAGLRRAEVPHATTAVRVFQQVGGSFGVAVLAVARQRGASGARSLDALAGAFGHTFWWAAGAAAPALVPILLMRGKTPGGPVAPAPSPGTTAPEAAAPEVTPA